MSRFVFGGHGKAKIGPPDECAFGLMEIVSRLNYFHLSSNRELGVYVPYDCIFHPPNTLSSPPPLRPSIG